MRLDEETLLKRAQKGNGRAFEELVRLYETRLFLYANSIVGNRQDAEEITQDAFVKAWNALPRFRGEASLSTWLMRIVRNTATDVLRKRCEPLLSLTVADDEGESEMLSIADDDPDSNPPKAYERAEKIAIVRRAIAQLPPEQREILTLRDLNGYRYDEIAEILSLEDGTVRSRLNRARKNLKKVLESWNFSF